jgi:hypothetical protein
MATSRHRKNHKQKVQQHKRELQARRANFKKLTNELEEAILKAQQEQPIETQEIKITGQSPKGLPAQEIKL